MSRTADHEIEPLILARRSSRAMSGEKVSQTELRRLFEAARWAPSSSNRQPWRFAWAMRETAEFKAYSGLLADGNKPWCKNASALVVVASQSEFSGKLSRTHAFDTGAAWMSLALQGHSMGLVVHAMEGFNYIRARAYSRAPIEWEVHCMLAVGRPGKVDDLPDKYRERETPSGRDPIEDFVFSGTFER